MIRMTIWVQTKILTTKTIHSNIAIIITAAGSSTRIGGGIKKEYLPLKNGTVLSVCAETFLNAFKRDGICESAELAELAESVPAITDFIVTCPKGGIDACRTALGSLRDLAENIVIVEGAETRQKSVYNGLLAIKGQPDIVLIHDGARPFVSREVILAALEGAIQHGASVPGITPTDTQKEIDENGFITRHLSRSSLTAVQTPQCFDIQLLKSANKQPFNDGFTDDASVVEAFGFHITLVDGNRENIKITTPYDMKIAEVLMR